MSEELLIKDHITPEEQAVQEQLNVDIPGGRQSYSPDSNTTIRVASIPETHFPNKIKDNDDRYYEGSSQFTHKSTGNERIHRVETASIAQDTVTVKNKGRLFPPRFPSTSKDQLSTLAQVTDNYTSANSEVGTVSVSRKTMTNTQYNKDGKVTKRTSTPMATKRTSHAPKGLNGQDYHVRFTGDKEIIDAKVQRYSELITKLATKRIQGSMRGAHEARQDKSIK